METKIAIIMSRRGISNKSLARVLDVTDAVICRWKRGQVCVPPGRRKQLAEALGVEVDDILDDRGFAKLAEVNTMQTAVERIMRQRGITNKSLARTLGVTNAVVCGWKRGRIYVPPGRRKQLAEALGVRVDEILDAIGFAKTC